MYFLDMMNVDAAVDRLIILGIAIMVIIFVVLLCLTIVAVRKTNNPGNAESGENGSGKGGSGIMLKVMIVLDCIFFVFVASIL